MLENLIAEDLHLEIVLILAVGFTFSSIFSYIFHRTKLSPILSYLLAGWLIGPFSPGFVANQEVAEQLAEIGVVLMMFGVGLHLKLSDLLSVKKIAILGALLQTIIAASICVAAMYFMGFSIEAGIIFGLAIGVASTVVLIRGLIDNHLIHTLRGHIAIGWLIVEDVMTVAALLFLPTLQVSLNGGDVNALDVLWSLVLVLTKFSLLALFMFTLGRRIIIFILARVMRLKSEELLTLTILSLTFVIALLSALVFGTSIALGAFVAGLIIGQTSSRDVVAVNAMPMKDIFLVVFFLSVGMLFNPRAIVDHPMLFATALAVTMIAKPLSALFITWMFNYSFKTALTIAVSLAQIGEFSFILAEEAMKLKILPDAGYDVIVACAFISISFNPLLFRFFRLSDGHK